MDDGGMADGNVVAQQARILIGQMQHGVVLNVCVMTNNDLINVSTQHGVMPDTRTIPDRDVANHHCSLSEIDIGTDHRLFSQKSFKLLDDVCHGNRLKQEPVALPTKN